MNESVLHGKYIVLGVTGSIAAYKACTVASHLTQDGVKVDVIMTQAATRFVAPLTFQALTGRPVYTSMWESDVKGGLETHITHVGLAHDADLLLIAPATAHTMARLAHGLADDLLSVTALAARCPVLVAPAMDVGMYEAPATRANVETLRARDVHFAGPAEGRMASGLYGYGRFLGPDAIIGHCRRVMGLNGPLRGKRVVVTAGPTREALDPVRFISNRSSGKQGFALAQAAIDAGAEVTLITGPVNLSTPVGVERINVHTAHQMQEEVLATLSDRHPPDALIMAAAVSDFRPAETREQKIKKHGNVPQIELARNPDILLSVAESDKRPEVMIGFAAESENLLANAREKLVRKSLDMIVANDIIGGDAGFAADTNRVHLITQQGSEALPLMSKAAVASKIIAWLADYVDAR